MTPRLLDRLRAASVPLFLAGGIAAASPALAAECPEVSGPPAGTVAGTGKSVGFVVGARWGEGTLTLADGTQKKFTVKGAKMIETGAADIEFSGEVYNLANVADFEGDYGAASAGITVGDADVGEAWLNNEKCVYMKVALTTEGLRASAPAPGGVLITFDD